MLSPAALTVVEGADATYTVRLGSAPSAGVLVTVARHSGSIDVSFDTGSTGLQNTLSFTTTNWSTPQTVTVTAAEDDDTEDDSAVLRHTAIGGGYDAYAASLAVTVSEDDTGSAEAPVVTVSADRTAIEEGAAVTFTFTASPAPSAEDGIEVHFDLSGWPGAYIVGQRTPSFVAIPMGETSATLVVQTAPDRAGDTDATMTLDLDDATAANDGYTLGDADNVEVSVTQSSAPAVSIAAAPATITEGEGITLTFTADEAAPAGGLAVKYVVRSGTAFGLPDYQTEQTATIAAGETAATVAVATRPDPNGGSDVGVSFEVVNSVSATGAAYLAGTPDRASVTVRQDTTAPALRSARAVGTALTLTWDEKLDEGSVPAAGAFAVTVAGAARTVTGVAVAGRAVTLTLASAVAPGEAVTLAYTVPSSNPIQDAAGNDAADLSGQTVEAPAVPTVKSVGIVSPASGYTFRYGETIEVQVAFTSRLEVTGAPRLALTVGSQTRYAAFSRGDSLLNEIRGFAVVAFTYRVQAGDHDADGIGVAGPIELAGGAIRGRGDLSGDALLDLGAHAIAASAGHKVDARTGVTGIDITSSPASGDTYRAGETIDVGVTLGTTAHVDDTGGTPRLALVIGDAVQHATYRLAIRPTAGRTLLIFNYTVRAGDGDADGISVPADAIELNGGVLRDAATGGNALALTLAHAALPADGGHKVDACPCAPDTTAPVLSTETPPAILDGTLTLTYDERLDAGSVPGPDAFTVRVDGGARAVSRVAVSGSAVTLTLALVEVDAEESVTVSYVPPESNPIRDLAGNAADALDREAVRNDSAAAAGITLTALSPSPVPEGGSAVYTVVLDKRPSGLVAIEIGSDNPDVTVMPHLITFSSVNNGRLRWDGPRQVTVHAGQDPDDAHEPARIVHRVLGHSADGYRGLAPVSFALTVTDDEAPADATAPVLETAAVDGAALTLTYGEMLDAGSAPDPGRSR